MNSINQKSISRIVLFIFLASFQLACAQSNFPGAHWEQFSSVEEAGFSEAELSAVKEQFNSSSGAALMVIHEGKVVLAEGDISRRFMAHSIRKGLLNALYGIYVEKGTLNLTSTLASLNIDDINPLTSTEKKATIEDILSARSGIYLPSAYSPRGMEKNLPERGSHAPGAHWYYNNWDFNVLCTIFEQETDTKIFEEFERQIAAPLGMEDFRLSDGHYRVEEDKSRHPAYLFKMSARDMARFGLLYLNEGRWQEAQVVPSNWVKKSTSPISTDLGRFSGRGGFGYLWWVSNGVNGHPMYYTSGTGGQRIAVLPDMDMVVVHRSNTYENKRVSDADLMELITNIVNAKKSDAKPNASMKSLQSDRKSPEEVGLDEASLRRYLGSFKHPFLGYFTVKQGKSGMELHTNVGVFALTAIDTNVFHPEDLETPMEFLPAPSEEIKLTIKPVFDDKRNLLKAVFYY